MEKPLIRCMDTAEDVAKTLATRLIQRIKEYISETGSCIIALSGGRTPNAMFSVLASKEYIDEIDWEHTYFLWVDERFVPHTDVNSNFGKARQLLFSKIIGAQRVFPMQTNNGTIYEVADQYNKEIKAVFSFCNKEGADITLLGLGADGHTASLFPKSIVLSVDDRDIAVVIDGKNWERLTMTIPCILKSKELWFNVVGEEKKAALGRVLQQAASYIDEPWKKRAQKVLPAAILPLERAEFFVDNDANPLI